MRLLQRDLDLSRAREGSGIPIEPKPADLRTICRVIIEELESQGDRHRLDDVAGIARVIV